LYLDTSSKTELTGQVRDRWASEIPAPAGSDRVLEKGCVVLVSPVETDASACVGFPCCLAGSSSSFQWNRPWVSIAAAQGLGKDDGIRIIDGAIQALASTSVLREL
jgi:hypothetical protein